MTHKKRRMNEIAKITYLDGVRFHRALIAGIRQVISRQDYLNQINVFPVPDRDTGTNMALTLNAIIEGTYTLKRPSIRHLLEVVADSALNGARGNSGAILAQFFHGLSLGTQMVEDKLSPKQFVAAISTGVNVAHKALSEPKEGTILTVLRDFSDEITQRQMQQEDIDFLELLRFGIARAETSLQGTIQQLKALKKANVVDAGAQGWVDFLNGIYHFILNGSIKNLHWDDFPKPVESTEHLHEQDIDENFRFCTECLILGEDIQQDALRHALEELGNSLIVAGSAKKTKVHIHVNNPQTVFDLCSQYGRLVGEKADDMIHQQHSFNHREGKVAILTDSAADFPEGFIAALDIHVVPIVINFGTQTFLDKVSMTSREFYHELERNPNHPKTSQPSFGDFHRQYQYLHSHYESIIAIHVPRSTSGTLGTSEKAAERCKQDNEISVVDSCNATTGLGLIVQRAAEAAKAGCSHQQILTLIQTLIEKTELYIALPRLDYLIQGGRLSKKKQWLLKLFHLTAVIGLNKAGVVGFAGVLFGTQNISKKLAKFVSKKVSTDKKYRVNVVHTNARLLAEETQQALLHYFTQLEQNEIVDCGAALGVHVGPGAVAVSIQEYIDLPKLI